MTEEIEKTRLVFKDEADIAQLESIEPDGLYFSFVCFVEDETDSAVLVLNRNKQTRLNKLLGSTALNEALYYIKRFVLEHKKFKQVFWQPDVETMCIAYGYAMQGVLNRLKRNFTFYQLTDDDLMNEIRFSIFLISKGGNYVHKNNVYTFTRNRVVKMERRSRGRYSSEETDFDCLEDDSPNAEDQLIEAEDAEFTSKALNDIKKYIIDTYGKRQYEEILFEYSIHLASRWARKLVYCLKIKYYRMNHPKRRKHVAQ